MLLAKVRRHVVRLRRLLRRPIADQWLVLQAFVLLGISRWQIRRHGLKSVQQHLGARMLESAHDLTRAHAAEAERIGWAVTNVSIYTPWISNCFPQATAAKRLLDRRGIDATVYFGVSLEENVAERERFATEGFAAHSWTRSGEIILTGAAGLEAFKPIVWYGTQADDGLRT